MLAIYQDVERHSRHSYPLSMYEIKSEFSVSMFGGIVVFARVDWDWIFVAIHALND